MNKEELKITEEDINLLKEMKNNCLKTSVYEDEKRLLKANAITKFLVEHQEKQELIEYLKKENKKLRIQASSREEVANEYKEAIDKIKRICNKVPCDWSVCGIEVIHKIEKVLEEVE